MPGTVAVGRFGDGREPQWSRLSVAVVGAGVSGLAVARHLLALGARVTLLDAVDGERQRTATADLVAAGVDVRLGPLPTAPDPGTDLVVTSPGVPPTTPLFAAGVPVWGEVQLAWRLSTDQPWLVVTGTNGKTTTTEMLGAILDASGLYATTAGNIGTPLVDAVTAEPPYEVLAVELSSFQLHYTSTVAPHAAAILNVADDHLDWHGGADAYAAAKAKVWGDSEGNTDTIAIGNADDPVTVRLLAAAPGRQVTFGLGAKADVTVSGGVLVDRGFGGGPLLPAADLQAPGPHNLANALAAAALARSYGVLPEAIAEGLAGFRPGAHRNALVATVDGVAYVDDSKATNPHAAAASLGAYPSVVWIAGGLNKGLTFDDVVRGARGRLRAAVLVGRCADEVAAALARHAPDVPVERAGSMDDAVAAASRLAGPGDTVLLAPAAASMDMFRDYAARGDAFAAAVRGRTET